MSDMICIKIFENRMKAEVCKSYLEDQGVKVFLFSDDCGGMYPDLQMVTGGIKLMVHANDKEQAEKALEEFL